MKKLITIIIFNVLLFSCSPANLVITGKTRSPISPTSVVIYNSQTIPENYEIIGRLNVQSESTLGRSGAHKRNMQKLRNKAASVGANGLIVGDVNNSHNAWGDGFMSMNTTAIYVDSNAEITEDDLNTNSAITKTISKADRLRELKKLLDEGILTEKEYGIEKKKVLDGN